MCGFSGQISFNSPINRRDIETSIDAIKYRGPDALGYWYHENGLIGLGHRRLSIIDLSSSAHQPMLDKNESLIIAFNGEIYNFKKIKQYLIQLGYTFKTESDTEVILKSYQEWGFDCIQKFEGMFSFFLVDLTTSIAFVARDRAGEKPFYYYYDDANFIFSSELKGVLAFTQVNRVIDFVSLCHLFNRGFTPSNKALIKDIHKLPPAHAAIIKIKTGEIKTWQYWKLPDLKSSSSIIDEDLHQELLDLMNQSVKNQMITDVPLGILLSGGLDSSIITALAARNSSTIRTYTVTFPSHSVYNEADEALLVSKHFGTQHTELIADQINFDDILSIAKQLDEPIFDSSIIPTFLVSSLLSKYCKVALGGDGGDELFGGYGYYQDVIKAHHRTRQLPTWVLKCIGNFAGNTFPLGKPGRNYLQHLYPLSWIGEQSVSRFFDEQSLEKLFPNNYDRSIKVNERKELNIYDDDWIKLITRQDFYTYLPEDILVKVDRASMLNSLEIRAPFLNREVIEFAFSKVQSSEKVTISDKKILLKRVFKSLLPNSFNYSRKQGFSIPLAKWMNEPKWIKGLSEILLTSEQGVFNQSYIKELLSNQQKGYSNSERLFGLFLFEVWRRQNNIQFS